MALIFVAFVSLLVAVFGVFFIILELYVGVIGNIKGAPFVPSKPQRIRTMVELADIKEGTRAVDLGSGDGAILLEAARHGAVATGIEMNPFLIPYARWRAKRNGLADRVTVIKGDIWDYPLQDAEVVFLYLLPKFLGKLKGKLTTELASGTLVVSNAFPVPGWTPIQEKDGVFLYRQK